MDDRVVLIQVTRASVGFLAIPVSPEFTADNALVTANVLWRISEQCKDCGLSHQRYSDLRASHLVFIMSGDIRGR
jgi:hypothetical protein